MGWRALLAALALAIAWLAFVPDPPETVGTGWDKLNHVLAFAALTTSAGQAFVRMPLRRIVLGLLAYGLFIELVQTQIPGRSGEWPDLLADGVGIALALLLQRLWRQRPGR